MASVAELKLPIPPTVDTVGNLGLAGNPYIRNEARKTQIPLDYIRLVWPDSCWSYHVSDLNFDSVNVRVSVFIAKEAAYGISVISSGRCNGISGITIPLLSV
jgi:hypothetical protein